MKLTKPIATGNTADVYLWDELAVKMYKKDMPLKEVESEAERQMLALKYGINVPKVFDVRKINGKPALVMEYIAMGR